ncbi:Ribonuclease H domain [Sesbania bispinosa]|nr:Ribonuclease H domain [Sesbania bispinosa]
MRNDLVFNQVTPNVHVALSLIHSSVNDCLVVHDSGQGNKNLRRICDVGWTTPPEDWVKVNTDGSVRNGGAQAACGGIIRNHLGGWLLGFQENLGSASVLMAEMRGIINGLEVAWSLGAEKVLLECDSMVDVKLVTDGVSDVHPYSFLVKRIRDLLVRHWEVKVCHIWREGNCVADCLANAGHDSAFGVHTLHLAPTYVSVFLQFDAMGCRVPRLIAV